MKLTRGERFRDAREVHNQHGKQTMSIVEKSTGVGKSTIQALEDDGSSRDVGYEKVAKLAAHYGVSADYLLGLSDDPSRRPSAVHTLGLSPESVGFISMCKYQEGMIDFLDFLLRSTVFQFFIENLHEYFLSSQAGNIFFAMHDHIFPEGGTLDEGNRFYAILLRALEDKPFTTGTVEFLRAVIGILHTPDFPLDIMDGERFTMPEDFLELKANKSFAWLMNEINRFAKEQGSLENLPESFVSAVVSGVNALSADKPTEQKE